MFGTGGGQALAEEMNLPFLGATAMSSDYTNSKKPAALESDAVAAEYTSISKKLTAEITVN